MIRLLLQSTVRQFQSDKLLHLLTLLGIALGAAAVVGVQILHQSAIAAFAGSVQAVRGNSELTVFGSAPSFDERVLVDVLGTVGVESATPRVQLSVAVDPSSGDGFLELAGLDVLSLASLPYREEFELREALSQPGWLALTAEGADRLGLSLGDRVNVSCGSRTAELQLSNWVELEQLGPAASPMRGVMDIAALQQLLGQIGEIHQIDVALVEGQEPDSVAASLEQRLGPAYEILTPSQQVGQAEQLLGAFRLNLTALSAVSLFVGFFMVYTTVQAMLVRRRREFGVMRCLGTTRGQLLFLVLGEVAILGFAGSFLGTLLGIGVAQGSLADVSATLTNLYVLEEVRSLALSPSLIPLALLAGVGGALAGAAWPTLESLGRPPRELLQSQPVHERLHRVSGLAWWIGLVLLGGTGVWCLTWGRQVRPAGFVLGLAMLLTIPLITPRLLRVWKVVPAHQFGVLHGLRSLASRLHGSAFCSASLAVSVSILVGITMMVSSFRSTLESWVDSVIQADVYVTAASYARSRSDAILEQSVIDELVRHPAVREADLLRRVDSRIAERPVPLIGVRMDLPDGTRRFPLTSGEDPEPVYRRLQDEQAVLISQPLARRLGLEDSAEFDLPTPEGPQSVPIAGIYEDYGSESGAVAMDLTTMEALFGEGPLHSVSLYLDEGTDPEQVVTALAARLPEVPLEIRSNARLRAEVFRIFDQTFLVTRTLQLVTLLVAALGVATTLLVIAEEGRSEVALARSLGADRPQVFRVFLGKGAGIGVVGVILGLTGGMGLAWILVHLINRAYFGWSIRADWGALFMVPEFASIGAAVLLASLYPAWKASRTPAVELKRDDS